MNSSPSSLTTKIYTWIQNGDLEIAIENLMNLKNCLAKYSLMAYCYYNLGEYHKAQEQYANCLAVEFKYNYKLYYAMCLYNLGEYEAAYQACVSLNEPQVLAAIKYEQGEIDMCLQLLDKCKNSMDVLYNKSCLLIRQNKNKEGLELLLDYKKKYGFKADVAYVISLAQYNQKNFEEALKTINEVILKGFQDYPDFQKTKERDIYLHNSDALTKSCLIEAHNLKACILQSTKQDNLVSTTLLEMPRRHESQIDAITLHNLAITQSQDSPIESCDKLKHILSQPHIEVDDAFKNLILLYIQLGQIALAADLLAQHEKLAKDLLDQSSKEYIDAVLLQLGSSTHSFEILEKLVKSEREKVKFFLNMKKETKSKSSEVLESLMEHCTRLNQFIMAQGKLLWDDKKYKVLEQLLRQHADYLSDSDVWKINLANVYFIQEKYSDAIPLYESANSNQAVVSGNLCVCYISSHLNEKAEILLTKIEDSVQRCYINLMIGTLYCVNDNYQFGLDKIMESVEPIDKLTIDNWFYIKRIFLSHLYKIATVQIMPELVIDLIQFLQSIDELTINETIRKESRLLQFAYFKISD
eukprot:NODE_64_length_24072_cov_0.332541.p5 type:complete len:582 gc:universal NODE_64_length_24072_cov_0.332541:2040-295(-)